ncbi:methyl-accepting chemotaxis protein [Aetokthonos hydrillicola Thurmond2011]|uniref:Methyl-accepting chemotaxis protein n=1 Tax=Aetokthonos hydrillicola Thurmond2011 TaxID=2712845 RepID=A0AAP5I833_9CYAN|nr:methyl-accepting chemotaxis protein [Aetokthonos hydrillicola]MDR9894958.1 methyl-accepting chemotaxis protein [Aetokthonos hydrillicola Thurmond2011]
MSIKKQLRQRWYNLSFRGKLTLLLVIGAVLPVIVATQGLVTVLQSELIQNLQNRLRIQSNILQGKLDHLRSNEEREAQNLASIVESQQWSLNRPEQVAVLRNLISNYIALNSKESFYIITNAQGESVAQYIQKVQEDFSTYPPLPGEDFKKTEFRSVSLPTGIKLGDISIVKDALLYQRRFSGVELFKSEWLKRLGLEQQAAIGVRTQPIQGLSQAQRPFPRGTYDIDDGKMGLVTLAVYPIRIQGKLEGTTIVGTVLNRNYELVDQLQQETKTGTSALSARDWRVSATTPAADGKTRAIGTRISREVAEKVLNDKQIFSGFVNVAGLTRFSLYKPLYDHQQTLEPNAVKPIGILSVGVSNAQVQTTLNTLRLAGWGIGVGIGILAGLAAIPIAQAVSNPLRRLTNYTQQVGKGDLTTKVELTEAQDEIAKLLASFYTMTKNLNSLIRQVQQSGVQITTSTTHIASSGKELEATLDQQIASTNQVAATAKKIADTSFQLVQTMEAVEQASQVTAAAAGTSQIDLMYMGNSISQLVTGTKIISTKLAMIGEEADNINSIIITITKVAAQTNLLSLNAAIEAEKAGEYGKGFAVVAREIRSLADQTAVATLDIENMVKQMQAAVSTGVTEMDKFTTQVEYYAADVKNISTKLETIIEQVQALSPQFQQVSVGMETQSDGAQQISEAIQQLTEVSEKTATSLESINAAIWQLNDAVVDLRQEISHFQVTDG